MLYIWIVIAVVVTAADQLSKLLILNNFSSTDHLTLLPGILDIVYVQNRGAAFSILNSHTWLLGAVSAAFCVAITVYMLKKKPQKKLLLLCGGLLLGGALGNGIDRIFRGFVVDFIEITLFRFPVFNVADIAITAGAALLVINVILNDKKEQSL